MKRALDGNAVRERKRETDCIIFGNLNLCGGFHKMLSVTIFKIKQFIKSGTGSDWHKLNASLSTPWNLLTSISLFYIFLPRK